MITFMFVAQVPFLVIGDTGAWLNIALLSLQLVSSGALIPRELMSSAYVWLGTILPATYAVEGIMNDVLGGVSSTSILLSLLWITLGAIGIGISVILLKREYVEHLKPVSTLSE